MPRCKPVRPVTGSRFGLPGEPLVPWVAVPHALSARGTPQENHRYGTRGPRTRTCKGSFVANIKSQIKRIKTNEKARLRNKAVKSSLKTAVRKAREAAAAGDVEKATEYQRAAARQLDKAVSKGVIHANQAANRKSSIFKKAASL